MCKYALCKQPINIIWHGVIYCHHINYVCTCNDWELIKLFVTKNIYIKEPQLV